LIFSQAADPATHRLHPPTQRRSPCQGRSRIYRRGLAALARKREAPSHLPAVAPAAISNQVAELPQMAAGSGEPASDHSERRERCAQNLENSSPRHWEPRSPLFDHRHESPHAQPQVPTAVPWTPHPWSLHALTATASAAASQPNPRPALLLTTAQPSRHYEQLTGQVIRFT